MTNDEQPKKGFSLRRWSERKLAASRAVEAPSVAAASANEVDATQVTPAPESAAPVDAPQTSSLPPPETLTFDSDFTGYLRPDVDETVRRSALKKLFSDPRFNVMDGLDVYIDDYSKPDPIDPEVVRTLVQARYIFDPPRTRINAEGFAEDVPPDEPESATQASSPPPVSEDSIAANSDAPSLPAPDSSTGNAIDARNVAAAPPEPANPLEATDEPSNMAASASTSERAGTAQ